MGIATSGKKMLKASSSNRINQTCGLGLTFRHISDGINLLERVM